MPLLCVPSGPISEPWGSHGTCPQYLKSPGEVLPGHGLLGVPVEPFALNLYLYVTSGDSLVLKA